MKNKFFIVLALTFSINTWAKLTPEQQEKYNSWMSYVNNMDQSYAKYPVDMCGREIKIDIDQNMVEPFMAASANAEMYCEELRTKLSTMCRNAASLKNNNKEKINKLIKSIKCTASTNEEGLDFKIQNGVLVATMGAKASNLSENLLLFMDSQSISGAPAAAAAATPAVAAPTAQPAAQPATTPAKVANDVNKALDAKNKLEELRKKLKGK